MVLLAFLLFGEGIHFFSPFFPVLFFLSYFWGMNQEKTEEKKDGNTDAARRARGLYDEARAAMKRSAWGEAISLLLQSEALEPDGPAREAREMLDDIMAFYNKDMYNQ